MLRHFQIQRAADALRIGENSSRSCLMNWLAHLYLSEPSPAFLVGSLLPDMLPVRDLVDLPSEFQQGIQRHLQIDAFTDSHPVFRRCVNRIDPPLRRYGAILVDVFFDHVLSRSWDKWSKTELSVFVSNFNEAFVSVAGDIPPLARERIEHMISANWLGSYHEISGITSALERLSHRLRRPVNLAHAVTHLEQDYDSFREDFDAFFPELKIRVLG